VNVEGGRSGLAMAVAGRLGSGEWQMHLGANEAKGTSGN
jgi:hypothetical protein